MVPVLKYRVIWYQYRRMGLYGTSIKVQGYMVPVLKYGVIWYQYQRMTSDLTEEFIYIANEINQMNRKGGYYVES